MPPHQYILCVEDDDDACELFRVTMPEYQFVFVSKRAEALEQAADGQAGLFLLDVLLPDCSGLELCRELKVLFPQTPVVFCSGAARDSDRRAGLGAGGTAYLVKPLNYDLLREVVQALFNRQPGSERTAA